MQILFYSRDVFLLDRALIRGKYAAKWGVQMAGINFKTHHGEFQGTAFISAS